MDLLDRRVCLASQAHRALLDGRDLLGLQDLWVSLVRLACLVALDCVESLGFKGTPVIQDTPVPLGQPVSKMFVLCEKFFIRTERYSHLD